MIAKYKNNPYIIFGLSIIAFLLITIACGGSTPEVNPPQASQPAQSSPQTTQDTNQATPLPPPTETPKPIGSARSNPAPFGYEVTMDDMTFTVTEFIRPADDIALKGNMFNTPEEGKEFAFVNMSIKCNLGSDDKCNIGPSEFQIVGTSGTAMDAEWLVTGVSGMLESGEFFGGATKAGYIAFQLEKGETDLILIYKPFLGSEAYFLVQQ
jgi:hypothetical protein